MDYIRLRDKKGIADEYNIDKIIRYLKTCVRSFPSRRMFLVFGKRRRLTGLHTLTSDELSY